MGDRSILLRTKAAALVLPLLLLAAPPIQDATPTTTSELTETPAGSELPRSTTEVPTVSPTATQSLAAGPTIDPSPSATITPITPSLTADAYVAESTQTGTPTPLPAPSMDVDGVPNPPGLRMLLSQAAPSGDMLVLYDQTDNPMSPPSAGISSQKFEDAFNSLDDQAADDFFVPPGNGWVIERIEVAGFYAGGGSRNATSVNVYFYKDRDGLPGDQIYKAMGVPVTTGESSGSFIIDLGDNPVAVGGVRNPAYKKVPPVPPEIAGHYWVSVQANLDYLPDGRQWAWQKRMAQTGAESAWQNPNGGFGKPMCRTWGSRVSTCGSIGGPDLLFRLSGKSGPSATTSLYVNTDSASVLYELGRDYGQEAMSGLFLLDFGRPYTQSTGYYVLLLSNGRMVSIADASTLAEAFIDGWANGYWTQGAQISPDAEIIVGFGLSNCGLRTDNIFPVNSDIKCIPGTSTLKPAHGDRWAEATTSIRNHIVQRGFASRISVVAAMDIQLSWNLADLTIGWVDAYSGYFRGAEVEPIRLLDYGSCEGCDNCFFEGTSDINPSCDLPFESFKLTNKEIVGPWNWKIRQAWYKAEGAPFSHAVPEIYRQDGINAAQWYALSVYSHDWTAEGRIRYFGVLTQLLSCNMCDSMGNSPAQGWAQLMNILGTDTRTRLSSVIPLTTDILYLYPNACFDC